MVSNKITFENKDGQKLSARLELPVDQSPAAFALFAHCFTCNKNYKAMHNISRALTAAGYGVLRFDFTGLGESEGDFSDTNFSGNIQDLLAAAEMMEEKYQAPALLIGHSLGGAAVIYAATELPSVKAVVTIGTPSSPAHVKKLILSHEEDISKTGMAEVNIGGRNFTIKKQFLDDLEETNMEQVLQKLRKALLVAHAPQDNVVGIDNAAEIFVAARHPKSFVSLDGADHLLSDTADSTYLGNLIAVWARRYIDMRVTELPGTAHQVIARAGGENKFLTQLRAGQHRFVADEPQSVGGNDAGPSPYDLLAAALASCTAMTLRMYADHKKWNLTEVDVMVDHAKSHADDGLPNDDGATGKIDKFTRYLALSGDLDEEQRSRLLEIANRCPVHKTLLSDIHIETTLKPAKK
ncbi:MAG: bifunctional alpha/beta hydrolase/OsmC family protein [Bacteroidales bacterium]|nr:bifunctional alpha/beta hydrolase/OsmC family protein [Bacteroidales bacterium]MDD4177324.1 bifunctional alpha/beta hydrolase/OsmC family protein [Bacteroidales bacterium]MDY0334208.1 bifunctional alpha/beta hydrolase/OsmC family protein [Bacteroidales bacterium]NCU35531.1 OsmC family protein [Candidatus Falkowbacteria bacterium]